MRTKHIMGWNDMREFGFNYLTGESDALGMRGLIDLNAIGVVIFKEVFGLPPDFKLAKNWNSGSVASVLIPHSGIDPFAVIALLKNGFNFACVIENKHRKFVTGFDCETRLEVVAYIKDFLDGEHADYRIYGNPKSQAGVTEGFRNVHQMTGRIS